MKLETTLPERVGFLYAVPVCDLFILLMIAVVMGPTFLSQTGVQVETPVSEYQVPRHTDASVITVTQGNPPVIWLERQKVTQEELSEKLEERRASSSKIPVIYVRSDEEIPAGVERGVAEIALKAGFRVYLLGRSAEETK